MKGHVVLRSLLVLILIPLLFTSSCTSDQVAEDTTALYVVPADVCISDFAIDKIEYTKEDQLFEEGYRLETKSIYTKYVMDTEDLQETISELHQRIEQLQNEIEIEDDESRKTNSELYLRNITSILLFYQALSENGCSQMEYRGDDYLGFFQYIFLFDTIENAQKAIHELHQPMIDRLETIQPLIFSSSLKSIHSHDIDFSKHEFSDDSWGEIITSNLDNSFFNYHYESIIFIRINNLISAIYVIGQPDTNIVFQADSPDDAKMLSKFAQDIIIDKIHTLIPK